MLKRIYRELYSTFGPQKWWPGETAFEVIVGAILTQNTNWKNVEKAIVNLKSARVLSPQALHKIPAAKLAALIKPVGYFNIKAKRLKNFLSFLYKEYGGKLARMEREDLPVLRRKLLGVNGIGPETADSILLYAFDKPSFVVDAYTKRIFSRHKIISRDIDYSALQELFAKNLKTDVKMFNEYHALIVRLGKDFCQAKAKCEQCPLNYLNKLKQYRYGKEQRT